MDTIVTKRIPSCCFFLHSSGLHFLNFSSLSSLVLTHSFAERPSLSFFSEQTLWEAETKRQQTKGGEPRQSDTLCPFLSFLTRLSSLCRLKLTRSEWIEICVDVCALNAKIWRGRREWGGSGRRRDQEEAHVIDHVHLQLNSELQPTLTVNTHAYTGYTEQHNTVPFMVKEGLNCVRVALAYSATALI